MSVPYGTPDPDAETWYDPADDTVYPCGSTVDEALEEKQRRAWQDHQAAHVVRLARRQPAARRVAWRRASDITIKRRTWAWENRVPLGEVTLWVGHGGVGKSQAAAWLAAEITQGRLPGALYGTPSPVMYVATEDSWEHTLAPRLLAAGADMDEVLAVHTETQVGDDVAEGTVSLEVDVPSLRDAIEATGTRVIVLDALLSTMTGADLMKQGVVRSLLEPLSKLAQSRELAVIGIAHFRKAPGPEPLLMISGSAEFGQVVRSAVGFARDGDAEDGSCVLSLIKTNIAPSDTPSLRYVIAPARVTAEDGQPTDAGRFQLLGETSQHVSDLLNRVPVGADEQSERSEAREWLVTYLVDAGGRAQAGEVIRAAEEAGLSKDKVKKARRQIGARTDKSDFTGHWEWVLDSAQGAEGAQRAGHTRMAPSETFTRMCEGSCGLPLGDEPDNVDGYHAECHPGGQV